MKNKIIALMALVPLIIMFTVMTLTEAASVRVQIPVSGVEITTPTEGGVLSIDMAEYEYDSFLQVDVVPSGAANKGYKVSFSPADGGEGDAEGIIEIGEDGLIEPLDAGMVKVTVTTDDGGFRDSIIVNVVSTKALGAAVSASVFDEPSRIYAAAPSALAGVDFELEIPKGKFVFDSVVHPSSVAADIGYSSAPYIDAVSAGFEIHPVTGIAYARLSGEYLLDVSLSPAVSGRETVSVLVRVSDDGFTVEGEKTASTVRVLPGSSQKTVYAECASAPTAPAVLPEGIESVDVTPVAAGQYAVTVSFADGVGDDGDALVLELASESDTHTVTFEFAESISELYSRYGDAESGLLLQKNGTTVTYAAVTEPSVPEGMTFEFEAEGNAVAISGTDAVRGTCTVKALGEGRAVISLYSVTDGERRLEDRREIEVVKNFSSVVFGENSSTWGIGGVLAVGGLDCEDGEFVAAPRTLALKAYSGVIAESAEGEFEYTVSDPSVAEVTEQNGVVGLVVKGTGRVVVTASWKHTNVFNDGISTTLTLDCVADGVNVGDYESLVAATEAGMATVLTADIMLGENQFGEDGFLRPDADLGQYVRKLPTTADWAYYANRGMEHPTVNYCIEFKNDVYGNGMTLNADYITQVTPAVSSEKSVFKGPLNFVAIEGTAEVKAQDNMVFLVRTDGVVIDNVLLKGCSDESLYEDGEMDLAHLNTCGTVLEVMSDCRVVNSRLSNGRTVLRAFGRDGIDPVVTTDNPVDAEGEKIEVEVESCILANAREFLLKLGTNRKIRGEFVSTTTGNGYDTERMEPSLMLDGRSYSPSQDNLSDEEFVRNFVLTELTLENSALYNSGLFAIGFESSFAGPMLDGGMMPLDFWTDVGGTSYPALLRMVGEVRIYDWKPLSAVDSSTLIELPHGVGGNTAFLQLNIDDMLNKVRDYGGEEFADIISSLDGSDYVHGGMAFYGGGKNYSMVDFSQFAGESMERFDINLGVLAQGEPSNSALYLQGSLLPLAAGTQSFRFFMYGASSDFGYAKQTEIISSGTAYDFIVPAAH